MQGQIQPILTLGDSRLEQVCEAVSPEDPRLGQQLADLHATLNDFRVRKGFGRAMAAPQIGLLQRIIVMNLGAGPVSILNPVITWRSEEDFEVWDDCLSIPDWVVRVRRAKSIDLTYQDEQGRTRHWRRLPETLSELLQHEVDHLDGILMTARAWGPDAVRPIEEHASLVGAGRPKPRLRLDAVRRAAETIDPVFTQSPQYESDSLNAALGCQVRLKVETVNPIRSFKGRGADFFVAEALPRMEGRALVCASAGNWGQALAYATARRRLPLIVYASTTANPLKVERMRQLGAEVRQEGGDFDAAKLAAKRWAEAHGAWMVEDGLEREISEGAGTIGLELLADNPAIDAVYVPLGNGALLNGVARWVKAASPATRVIGVCASGATAMKRAFETGALAAAESMDTIADGIGVRVPIAEAVEDMKDQVDAVVTVSDAEIEEAIRLAYEHTRLLIEPAGAAGLAAIAQQREQLAGQHVATVLCGGNLTDEQVRRWILR